MITNPCTEVDFRGLIEESPAGVYVLVHGRFTYANPRLAEILRPEPPTVLGGCALVDFAAPHERSKLQAVIDALQDVGAGEQSVEFDALCGGHGTVRVGTHLSARRIAGTTVLHGMLQDISEKRRMALEIDQHESQIKTSLLQTIDVILGLSNIRDPYTVGHERRVGEIARAVAQHLGMSEDQQEGVCVAGYLHDVGKVGVPAEILAKPARLSKAEYLLVQEHPGKGEAILRGVDFPWPVADAVAQHHERIDGSGYPHGLAGNAICIEARIVGVVDVLESMTSHRPYRPALGLEKALQELRDGRGRLYEPVVVDACLDLVSLGHPAVKAVLGDQRLGREGPLASFPTVLTSGNHGSPAGP